MPSLMYPAGAPSVNGDLITVDRWLKSPTRIQRSLSDLTAEQFIAYQLFAQLPGGVPSGSVIYSQQIQNLLYANRNVLERAPGDEFPLVDVSEGEEHTALTKEFGGAFDVTDKAVKRNDFSPIVRGLPRLRNTILKNNEALVVAALDNSPEPVPTTTITAPWDGTSGDPLTDFPKLIGLLEDNDFGYTADTFLTNPLTIRALQARKDVRDALPRESTTESPLFNKDLSGLYNLRFAGSKQVPLGSGWLLQSKTIGVVGTEEELQSEVVPIRLNRKSRVQAWCTLVPVVTDPYAAVKVNGLATP